MYEHTRQRSPFVTEFAKGNDALGSESKAQLDKQSWGSAAEFARRKTSDKRQPGAEDAIIGWAGGDGGIEFAGYDAGMADILAVTV